MNDEVKEKLDAMFPEAKKFVEELRVSKGDKYTSCVLFATVVRSATKLHEDHVFAKRVGAEHLFEFLEDAGLVGRTSEVLLDADVLLKKGLQNG